MGTVCRVELSGGQRKLMLLADAFRAVLAGHFGTQFTYDVLILLGFAAVFLVLVHRKLDWRAA